MSLNETAGRRVDRFVIDAERLRCAVHRAEGSSVLDCGALVRGGVQAGLELARICLADRATVELAATPDGPAVQIYTDEPISACLASQYAGRQVKGSSYFAMGSGPMRAIIGREPIFEHYPQLMEQSARAVGVLEASKLPPPEIMAELAGKCGVQPSGLTLLVAPAASIAGTLQVVARSVETALHKLHELKYDVRNVLSGWGSAPLPPVGNKEIKAIGWTNDAILYGGQVVLWVDDEDEVIAEIGPKVPSSASADYGAPFAEIFKRYQGDFYRIDPMLFSPARIEFRNLRTGRTQVFGRTNPDLLTRSFGG